MFAESTKAMQHLNIGLTAGEPMTSKYLKTGFPVHGFNIHNANYRRESRIEATNLSDKLDRSIKLEAVNDAMHEDIFLYQNSVMKVPKSEFYDIFLKVSSHVIAAIKDGAIVGYGALQETGENFRISPVHGETLEISGALLGYLVSLIPDGFKAVIPVPDVNKQFVNKTMEGSGFLEQSDDVMKRLYSKRNVVLPFHKIASIWNLDSIYP